MQTLSERFQSASSLFYTVFAELSNYTIRYYSLLFFKSCNYYNYDEVWARFSQSKRRKTEFEVWIIIFSPKIDKFLIIISWVILNT